MTEQLSVKGDSEVGALTIQCPGLWMQFNATQERINRIVQFMVNEANEAQIEFENGLKTQLLVSKSI